MGGGGREGGIGYTVGCSFTDLALCFSLLANVPLNYVTVANNFVMM